MSVVTLRRSRPTDAEAMALLMGDPEVYSGVLQMPFPSIEVWRSRLAENDAPGRTDLSLVAESEGQLVASAGLHGAGPALRRRHAMGLGMAVAKAWQGRGVGTQLMTALVDAADRWMAVLRIELTVYTDNPAALALYKKFGFQIEGTLRAYALRDGSYVDVHSMARLHPNPPRFQS